MYDDIQHDSVTLRESFAHHVDSFVVLDSCGELVTAWCMGIDAAIASAKAHLAHGDDEMAQIQSQYGSFGWSLGVWPDGTFTASRVDD